MRHTWGNKRQIAFGKTRPDLGTHVWRGTSILSTQVHQWYNVPQPFLQNMEQTVGSAGKSVLTSSQMSRPEKLLIGSQR